MTRRAALFLLLAARAAHANPIDAFGFGSRGPAMGNAVSAASDDGAANYYNPAALVRGTELRLDVGYNYAQPILRMNGFDAGVDASRGWHIGLVAPARIGPVRFAIGVGLFLPDQRLSRTRGLAFDRPRFAYYDNRIQRLLLVANLAIQIVPGLYLGAGLTFLSRSTGTVNLRGAVAVGDPEESALTTAIAVDLVAIRYPQVGLRWDATRHLTFAVTYRHSFQLDVDLGFDITGSIGNPGLPPIVDRASLKARTLTQDLFQPWQLTVGVAAHLLRPWLMTFDFTYAHFSEHPSAASQVDIALDVGIYNDSINLPPPREYPKAGYRNIFIPRVGTEVTAHDGDRLAAFLRGGYQYEPSPVPDQIGESSFADCDKHTFSVGAGLELKRLQPILPLPLSLDVHLGVTYLADRITRKADPRHPVGDFLQNGVVVQTGLMLRSRF